MRFFPKILQLTLVASPLALTACPKSKTDSSNARTEVEQIAHAVPNPSPESPATIPPQPVVKDPVPAQKAKVDGQAGSAKKPEKTKKGENLTVSSTHVEVVQPSNPSVSVVIEETPAATLTPAAQSAPEPELVQFPAVKLAGTNETVAVGETAEAILADAQPIQAAAVVVTDEVATPVAYVPEAVSADALAQLDTDLGQPIPVADVQEVVLTPDTEYTVTFVEETKPVDVATVVTLAAEPRITSAEQQPDGSIKLVVDPNGNPAGTLYSIAVVLPSTGEIVAYVDAATGAVLKEGQGRFSTLGSPVLIVKNLSEDGELVTFVIQAQNQKGELTSWSEETTVAPVAEDVLQVEDGVEIPEGDSTSVDPASVGVDVTTATDEDVQTRIDAGQTNLSALKGQLKDLKAQLDQIRKELKAKNAARRDVQKKLKKLEKNRKKNAQEIEKLKAELDSVQLAIDGFGKQLRDVKAEIKTLKGKVKDQASEIKKLKKVRAQMQKAAKKGGSKQKN